MFVAAPFLSVTWRPHCIGPCALELQASASRERPLLSKPLWLQTACLGGCLAVACPTWAVTQEAPPAVLGPRLRRSTNLFDSVFTAALCPSEQPVRLPSYCFTVRPTCYDAAAGTLSAQTSAVHLVSCS